MDHSIAPRELPRPYEAPSVRQVALSSPLVWLQRGARDLMRAMIALYVGGMGAPGRNFYYDLACAYGYEGEAARIQEHYLAGRKKEAEAAVPAEFCELTSLAGPADYVRDRVQAFRDAGVTMLNVTPVGPSPARLVEQVRGWL